jgi:hypothetical protein
MKIMKSIFAIMAFTMFIMFTSCGNDNRSAGDKDVDSIGNPTSNPSSTAVLTDDSTQVRNSDTMHVDTSRH